VTLLCRKRFQQSRPSASRMFEGDECAYVRHDPNRITLQCFITIYGPARVYASR
jgi:hypothetical protein